MSRSPHFHRPHSAQRLPPSPCGVLSALSGLLSSCGCSIECCSRDHRALYSSLIPLLAPHSTLVQTLLERPERASPGSSALRSVPFHPGFRRSSAAPPRRCSAAPSSLTEPSPTAESLPSPRPRSSAPLALLPAAAQRCAWRPGRELPDAKPLLFCLVRFACMAVPQTPSLDFSQKSLFYLMFSLIYYIFYYILL